MYVLQLVELTDMAAYLDTLTESWGRLPSTELAATMAAAARRDTAKKVRLRMRKLMDKMSTELAATMAAAARRDTAMKVRLRMRNLMDV
jgi:hypothetical protein